VERTCKKCGELKPETEFWKINKRWNNFTCKSCNREYMREYRKKYRQRQDVKEYNKAYNKEYKKTWRKRTDIKLHRLVMGYIKKALDVSTRSKTVFSKLGYSVEDLKLHIEKQFKDDMSWDNYGQWHIDHIIPRSWTPYTSIEDENFLKCWALSNLQPLWAKENLSKQNRFSGSPENPIAYLCDLDLK